MHRNNQAYCWINKVQKISSGLFKVTADTIVSMIFIIILGMLRIIHILKHFSDFLVLNSH